MFRANVFRENQNTNFVFSNFFFSENHTIYQIMWKNMVQSDRPQMTIWRMRIACWTTETLDTNTQEFIYGIFFMRLFNPLKPELNPICYLLALGAHHFLHVSRIRVKLLTFRLLMSYIYGAPILDVSRSHTTTQHSR